MADWVSAIAAVIALVISCFALFVSWSSANTAKRANDIQLHVYRKDLYNAFYDLYIRFRTEGQFINFDKVFEFQRFSKTSFLYVPEALNKDIDEFYIRCRKISEANLFLIGLTNLISEHRKAGFAEEELKGTLQAHNEKIEEIRKLLEETIPLSVKVHDELKEEVKLDKAPQGIWQKLKELYDNPFDWHDKQEPQ